MNEFFGIKTNYKQQSVKRLLLDKSNIDFNFLPMDINPNTNTVKNLKINSDILVSDVKKKKKLVTEIIPSKKVIDKDGMTSYKKAKGKKAKIITKLEPNDNDQIIVPSAQTMISYKEPIKLEDSCVTFLTRPTRKFIPIILLFIILLASLLCFSSCQNWFDPNARTGFYEGKSQEEILKDLNEEVNADSMVMSSAPYVIMSPGSNFVPEINVENISNNHCDQKFILRLKENGEILYESGALKPGEYIGDITINRSFEEGVYIGEIEFQGYERNITLGANGDIFGHNKFGAPSKFEILFIVTDDMKAANATAKHYLE